MALVHETVLTVADATQSVCESVAYLLTRIDWLLEHNSDMSIDWGAVETPAYITEDDKGNIYGRYCTRQNVANAIGSLDQIRKLLTNQAVTQGDHLGNVNLVSRPLRGA